MNYSEVCIKQCPECEALEQPHFPRHRFGMSRTGPGQYHVHRASGALLRTKGWPKCLGDTLIELFRCGNLKHGKRFSVSHGTLIRIYPR